MVKTDGILSEEPEGVILRRKNCLVQPRARPVYRLLFSPASVSCNRVGGGILFMHHHVWYGMLQKWVMRGGDFELTCSSHNENHLFHFNRFFSYVLSTQAHVLASDLLMYL